MNHPSFSELTAEEDVLGERTAIFKTREKSIFYLLRAATACGYP